MFTQSLIQECSNSFVHNISKWKLPKCLSTGERKTNYDMSDNGILFRVKMEQATGTRQQYESMSNALCFISEEC